MAKLSSINKKEQRKRLVPKYANKYAKLKAVAEDETRDESDRLSEGLKQAVLPRNAKPNRDRNSCAEPGRPRDSSRKFQPDQPILRGLATHCQHTGGTKSDRAG